MISRRLFCFAAASALIARETAAEPAPDAPARRLRVSMYSGATEYHSDETLAALKQYLEQRHNVQCTLNKVTDIHSMPGLDQLETCDVAVIFTRRVECPPEQVAQIKKYMESGRGVVGIRTASHAIQTWLEFDKEVLGGDYHNHDKADEQSNVQIDPGAKSHPILAGVEDFTTIGKLYRNPQIARDVTLLLSATNKDDHQPVAWARTRPEHKDQRVFYTSLGVPTDFDNENFRRMIANALFWCARMEPTAKSVK